MTFCICSLCCVVSTFQFAMVNSSKMGLVKYLLFAFNAIFVLCGIALIAVGGVVLAALSPQKPFYEGYLGAPVAIVVLGVFVFVIAFLGCCGAIRENYHMIMAFSVLLTIILICELGAAIAAYAYRSKIKDAIREEATKSIEQYSSNNDTQRLWDDIQSSVRRTALFCSCEFDAMGIRMLKHVAGIDNKPDVVAQLLRCCAARHKDAGWIPAWWRFF